MRGFKSTSLVLVGALMISGVLAASVSAKTARPSLKLEVNGEPLAPGAIVTASSSNFLVTEASGRVSCPDTSLGGMVQMNDQAKLDSIQITEARRARGHSATLELRDAPS